MIDIKLIRRRRRFMFQHPPHENTAKKNYCYLASFLNLVLNDKKVKRKLNKLEREK